MCESNGKYKENGQMAGRKAETGMEQKWLEAAEMVQKVNSDMMSSTGCEEAI